MQRGGKVQFKEFLHVCLARSLVMHETDCDMDLCALPTCVLHTEEYKAQLDRYQKDGTKTDSFV